MEDETWIKVKRFAKKHQYEFLAASIGFAIGGFYTLRLAGKVIDGREMVGADYLTMGDGTTKIMVHLKNGFSMSFAEKLAKNVAELDVIEETLDQVEAKLNDLEKAS